MVAYHGELAPAHQLFAASAPSITAEGPLFKRLAVSIVHTYKHLGTINHGPTHFELEAFARVGQAGTAHKSLAGNVFRNQLIDTMAPLFLELPSVV